MRLHAKASTAGSTQRQATGLGRTRFAQTAVLAAAIAVLMALAATPASAALQRNYESSFGTFSGESPQSLTVDQSNGDIYTFSNNSTVSRFSSAGTPKDFTAGPNAGTNTLTGISSEGSATNEIAIDNSGGPGEGTIYVADMNNGVVKAFANDGTPLASLNGSSTPAGAFAVPCGVAVDQANGDVYVAQLENVVSRYSPSGGPAEEADYSGGIATSILPCQIAVASGSLYAVNYFEGPLNKYATSDFALGAPPSASATVLDSKAQAVATDPGNGDVYVDEGDQIAVFSSSGTAKYSFGSGDFGSASFGVAVRAGGNAYVSDPSAHEIDVYGPFSAPPPLVETQPATGVKHTKATLHGHLDPNNSLPITGCVFEWGTDTSYGSSIPCTEGSAFNAPADVSGELTGLTPGTTYHFRLHITTGSGGFDGEDESFEAIPPSSVPEVLTGKGTIISGSSAQLSGTINPNANPITDCRFEYVDDIAIQATGFSDLSSGGSLPCDQAPGSIPADFEEHQVSATVSGLDPERIYRFRLVAENANGAGNGEAALIPGAPLVETTGSPTRTATTARLDSRVSSHGAPTTYRFEYVTDSQFQASGFAGAESTADIPLAVNEVQQIGVHKGFEDAYFILSFGGFATPELSAQASADQVQAALRALPSIGSPNVRVTAELAPFSGTYTVTFQGALASTDVDQLAVSPGTPPVFGELVRTPVPGGGGDRITFVSASVGGLQPDTTYHYRVVADNGTPGGPTFGADMTLTTRASDAALSHGHFPGPPGSDRAWEQVTVPDTGGNPVLNTFAFSDDGDRALYGLEGGNPGSEVGSYSNQLLAERTANGWKGNLIYPSRSQAQGNNWLEPAGRNDLSRLFAVNYDSAGTGSVDVWRLSPDAPAQHVFGWPSDGISYSALVSEDASRVLFRVSRTWGSLDPDHPVDTASPGANDLYDVTSGTPHLVSLLPDGSAPSCGVHEMFNARSKHLVSLDGSHVFFEASSSSTCSARQLYVRDLEAETTTQIASEASLIRSTEDAAFFITTGSLDPEDEGGYDVYRYDLGDESLDCLTCFPPLNTNGLNTDVSDSDIAVADDGSRLYFTSFHRLLPGVAERGLYRVEVASGDLAYVAPVSFSDHTGAAASLGNAISPDGSVFIFYSAAPALDFLNGPQSDATGQYYRYDDEDRSLVCVSCPADGSSPRGAVPLGLVKSSVVGPNVVPLSTAGDFAFSTPTALVPADQNTAGPGQAPKVGTDVYEWRDGRFLLVTDGLTASQGYPPQVAGVTPSGRDIFFLQAAQLTPDAIDAYTRLYTARIGGGFDFPTPPPPCSLEACQGTPRGVPEESRPGSLDFSGTGNQKTAPARCRKGKVRRRGRCVAKKHKRVKRANHRANHDRRASR